MYTQCMVRVTPRGIALLAIGSLVIVGGAVYAIAYSATDTNTLQRKQDTLASATLVPIVKSRDTPKPQVTQTNATVISASPSAKSLVTSSSTPPKTNPNPNSVYVCENILPTHTDCFYRDMTAFRVADVILWPAQLTCTANTIRVDFHSLTTSRDDKTGAPGTALIELDYSDGTSDSLQLNFPINNNTNPNVNFITDGTIKQTAGLSHVFNVDPNNIPTDLSFQVRVLSAADDHASQSWWPISEELGLNNTPICYRDTTDYVN
jgi:hypothetical protein